MSWQKTTNAIARILDAEVVGEDRMIKGVSTDTRTIKHGDLFFALSGPNFDANDFVSDAFAKGATAAVAQRANEVGPVLCVPDSLAALQTLAAAHRREYDIPLTAITGSSGKTSVKDYTAALLETKYQVVKTAGNLNNEIGCPLTLLQIDDDTEHAVIEMGANHGGEIARLCEIALPTESLITMVAPAHLEGFGSIDDVMHAKGEIAQGLRGEGTFYVNMDDPRCVAVGNSYSGPKVFVGGSGDVYLRDWNADASGELHLDIAPIGTIRLPLPSPKLVNNVLFAVAIGLRHGIEDFEGPIRSAITNHGRIKQISVGSYTILDDSYNANPASMAVAIDALSRMPQGPKAAVFGDMLEMGTDAARYHREVGEQVGTAGISTLFVRGEHGRDTIMGARANGVRVTEHIERHEEIAEALMAAMPDGGAVLVKGSRGMRMERVIDAIRNQIEKDECSIT